MQVILLENIANLGQLGSLVNVKPGYGRNYLVPQGKAVPATKENVEKVEARRAELEKAAAEALSAAQARAESMAELRVTIASKAGDEGKLFGSIGTRDVAEAISAAGNEVEKSEVKMPEGPIRSTGEHAIQLQLHSDVMVDATVVVVAEE